MKTLRIYLVVILFIALSACNIGKKKSILHISVDNISDSELLFFYPDRVSPDTIQLSDQNSVCIEFSNPGVLQVRILYADMYVPLFVEPGGEYKLLFDKNPDGKIRFTSEDTVQQQYYNLTAGRDIYKYEWIKSYTEAPCDTSGVRMLDNFRKLITADFSSFNTIPMSADVKNAMQKDTELYWLATLSKIIRNNYFKYVQDKGQMYPDYMEVWETIYRENPINDDCLQSVWLYHYVQGYTYYKIAHEYGKEFPEYTTSSAYWESGYNIWNHSAKDEKARETVLAEYLFIESLNNKTHDRALITHINNFLEKYPNNPNRQYFERYLAGLEEYYRIIAGDFSPGVKFVDGYEGLSTLQEVLSLFKGKPVFIDYWFSTCGPCIGEFQHTAVLKQFLNENDIEMLYISIDSERMKENWENAIKRYNLEGNHIRTSQNLHQDMHINYGIIHFPRYMIVNAEGEIVVERAKNPSAGDELINQIKDSLKI